MDSSLNILIVDDHPIFRQGLLKLLQLEPDFHIVGECSDGPEAVDEICIKKPNVVVLDISLPTMNGLDVVKKINQKDLDTQFVILTMYKDESYFNAALDLGVKGYLLKDNASSELVKCLKAIAAHKYYICPTLSEYLINRNDKQKELTDENPGLNKLTTAEKIVLKMISENKTSRKIAEELFISHRTVQNHRAHICEKLNFNGYNRLLQFALENKSKL